MSGAPPTGGPGTDGHDVYGGPTIARVPVVSPGTGRGDIAEAAPRVPMVSSSAPPTASPSGPGRAGADQRVVGPPRTRLGLAGRHPVLAAVALGIASGLVATWCADTVTDIVDSFDDLGYRAQTAAWTAVFGALICAFATARGARSTGRRSVVVDASLGLLLGAVAGAAGGYMVETVYGWFIDAVSSEPGVLQDAQWALLRGVAWAPLGLAVGGAAAIRHGGRRLIAGLLGGAAGSASGGAVLELLYQAGLPDSGKLPYYTGFVLTAVGILAGVTLADRQVRVLRMLVRTGPSAVREISIFRPSVTVGSNSGCDVVLANDADVVDEHLRITVSGRVLRLEPKAPVTVDGVGVTAATEVQSGTTIGLGSSAVELHLHRAVAPEPPPIPT